MHPRAASKCQAVCVPPLGGVCVCVCPRPGPLHPGEPSPDSYPPHLSRGSAAAVLVSTCLLSNHSLLPPAAWPWPSYLSSPL